MEEVGAIYKKSILRETWLKDLCKNLSLSENDATTYGEREFINFFISRAEEYLDNAYEPYYGEEEIRV